jgi:hypothetical protein
VFTLEISKNRRRNRSENCKCKQALTNRRKARFGRLYEDFGKTFGRLYEDSGQDAGRGSAPDVPEGIGWGGDPDGIFFEESGGGGSDGIFEESGGGGSGGIREMDAIEKRGPESSKIVQSPYIYTTYIIIFLGILLATAPKCSFRIYKIWLLVKQFKFRVVACRITINK